MAEDLAKYEVELKKAGIKITAEIQKQYQIKLENDLRKERIETLKKTSPIDKKVQKKEEEIRLFFSNLPV